MNRKFSERNRIRSESPNGFNHRLDAWSGSDWMVAFLGEAGEAANVLKKLNRVRDGIPGNKESHAELKEKFASELADAYVYLDLLCQAYEIDLEAAVNKVFDAKSKEIGYVEVN